MVYISLMLCDSGRCLGRLVAVEQLQCDVRYRSGGLDPPVHRAVPQRTSVRRRTHQDGILQRQPLSRSVVGPRLCTGNGAVEVRCLTTST